MPSVTKIVHAANRNGTSHRPREPEDEQQHERARSAARSTRPSRGRARRSDRGRAGSPPRRSPTPLAPRRRGRARGAASSVYPFASARSQRRDDVAVEDRGAACRLQRPGAPGRHRSRGARRATRWSRARTRGVARVGDAEDDDVAAVARAPRTALPAPSRTRSDSVPAPRTCSTAAARAARTRSRRRRSPRATRRAPPSGSGSSCAPRTPCEFST